MNSPDLPASQRFTPTLLGALACLALAIGSGVLEWRLSDRLRDQTASMSASILDAEALLSGLKDVETGQRGFVLVGDETYLDPYDTGRRDVVARLKDLETRAVPGDGAAAMALADLRQAVERKLDWTEQSVRMRRDIGREAAVDMIETRDGKRFMDEARAAVLRVQTQASERITQITRGAAQRSLLLFAASLAFAVTACLLLALYAARRRRAERQATALLDNVMDHAPVGLGLLDGALRVKHANPALGRLLNIAAGRGATALPADLSARIEPELRRVAASGKAGAEIEVSLRADDVLQHLLLGFFPLPNAIGHQPGHRGVGLVATDLTTRYRLQDDIRRSEARLRMVVDSVPQLAWMTDPAGEIEWYNRRWFDFTGSTLDEMRGSGWTKAHHPDHLDRVEAKFRAAIAAEEAWEDTFPLRGADGAYRWFLSRAMPLREEPIDESSKGRLIGWFGTNTDITEIRDAEESLTKAMSLAEEANRAKSQFIANMSHELRTPLSAVIGYSEMLEEEAEDLPGAQTFREDLAKIKSNARHLLSLINDVLDLSKIEAGKMDIHAEDFAADALLREVSDTVGALIAKKHNTLVLDIMDDLPPMHSDVVKIRQCLFNLIGNAAKFTEGGRITLSVQRSANDPQWLEFGIADSGIGMTQEQMERLFQRFTQADNSTTRRFGGTGLGLAITKAFVDMLGGDIQVSSEVGTGTRFTIRLPADIRAIATTDAEGAGIATDTHDDTEGGQAGLVLVIDDDAATRDLLARFLRREGFTVRTAPDGKAGLELARRLRPAVILLDVMMPRLDGWGVLSAVKADPSLRDTPVVMVTVVQERGLAISLGAADYLNKPVEWDRLKRVLDKCRPDPAPALALVVETDRAQRSALRGVLEREGWMVEEANGAADTIARMGGQPKPALLLINAESGENGDGFALIQELRRHPEWRCLPIIALTGDTVNAAEFRNLGTTVHETLPGEERIPGELTEELRRIAADHQRNRGQRAAGDSPPNAQGPRQ